MFSLNFIRTFFNYAGTYRNIRHVTYSNLKTMKIISVRNYSLNIYRSISSANLNQSNENKIDEIVTNLNVSCKQQKRIYKDDVVSVIKHIEVNGLTSEENIFLLLHCCGNLIPDEIPDKRISLAQRIWQTFQNQPLNVQHYNALLKCYIENQMVLSYEEFLNNMKCEANEETFHLLLKCVCEHGDVSQAVKIINIMKDKGLPANEPVFSSLILSHLKVGDVKSVQNILDTMRVAHLYPGLQTYTELLRGYAELGDSHNFKSTLNFAIRSFHFKTENIISVIQSICISGHTSPLPMIKKAWPEEVSSRPFQSKIINLCIHLIYLNKPEIAYNCFKCFIDPEVGFLTESDTYASVLFYEMAKMNSTESEKVIQIADDLISSGRNSLALYKATEAALRFLNYDLAVMLLKHLHAKNVKLRNHYFWPLLIHKAKLQKQSGIFEVFQIMRALDVHIQADTLETYSLKFIENLDPEIVITLLKQFQMKVKEIMTPLCIVLIRMNRLKKVSELCEKYKIKLDGACLTRPLAQAFLLNYDIKNTLNVLKCVEESSVDCTGQFLTYILTRPLKNVNLDQVLVLLKSFKQHKFQITTQTMDKIENITKRIHDEKIRYEIIQISNILTHSTDVNFTYIPHPRDMNLEELECHLTELENKKMETRGVLRKLIQMHCRIGNVERVTELCSMFEKHEYKMSAGMKAGLIDVYIKNEKLQQAYNMYEEILEKDPSFIVDEFKVIDLARLLILNNRFSNATAILKNESTKRQIRGGQSVEHNCWNLLNTTAKFGIAEETKELFNILTTCGYCRASNVILGPLIRVHLNNDNLNEAVKEYEYCCLKYKETPLQHELFCKLVNTESQIEHIRTVLDATQVVHGKQSAKMALTAALAETGKKKTLREFLMEQGVELPLFLLEKYCERWVKENNKIPLELLASCAKEITDVNLSVIYNSLMRIYYSNDDWKSALSLWNELQEKDYATSENIKTLLTSLLKNHNHPLPFQL